MSDEEHRRAQLVQIWEDLDQEGKNRFSTTLGFKGKSESRRRSVRRLVQGSRSISPEKQSIIGRSYSSRYGRDKVVDVQDYEKLDVTQYFKPYIIGRQRAWTGQAPPIAFDTSYRIRAIVMAVQEDSTVGWAAYEHTIWTSGTGRTFSQLAAMLQMEIDDIFDQPVGGKYSTFGIAFSDSGKAPLISRANESGRVDDEVASVATNLSVMIYSATTRPTKEGGETFSEVRYDD